MADWIAWHDGYDDANSSLGRRLRVVQRFIGHALDQARPGPIRLVQLCAGDARDLIGVARDHPRAADLTGRIIEFEPELAERARRGLAEARLTGLDVVAADAGDPSVYEGATPADLVLACGVFGNISDEDIDRTIDFFSAICADLARVVWTRGRFTPSDPTPGRIRDRFASRGFEELTFVAPEDTIFTVGVDRFVGPAAAFSSERLFSFVR